MSRILTPSALHVLSHLQSRTDTVLINQDNFGLTTNGEKAVTAIENIAFKLFADINNRSAAEPNLDYWQATSFERLGNDIRALTILKEIGNKEFVKEAQSWVDEFNWAIKGKSAAEIDKLYLEKYIPLTKSKKKHTR